MSVCSGPISPWWEWWTTSAQGVSSICRSGAPSICRPTRSDPMSTATSWSRAFDTRTPSGSAWTRGRFRRAKCPVSDAVDLKESLMGSLDNLRVKIFADGAELAGIVEMAHKPFIRGFTTNPTLMRKAGITDYRAFAADVLRQVPDRPISFEVFSDDFAEMEAQARQIASWGPHVNVKIPVTNTAGEFAGPLLTRLSAAGVFVNVTAIMTLEQVDAVLASLSGDAPAYISVFAGRIA